MKKTIKVKTDKKTGEHFLKLSDFKELVNISVIEYYTLEEVDDDGNKALILQFFDKNKKPLKIKNRG